MVKKNVSKNNQEIERDLISVIIPVYHPNIKFLNTAIYSLINQTYTNIEIIIVEDDPSGECEELINSINDSRIVYYKTSSRFGIAKSLNVGIELSKGKYIARMDSDDYALKSRLDKQYAYMEENEDIDVLGSWSISGSNKKIIIIDDIDPRRRRVKQLFVNEGLLHPTVMFRRSFLEKHGIRYNELFKMAEDYELWVNCCKHGNIKTLPLPTVLYRTHINQISNSGHTKELEYIKKVQINQFKQELQLSDKEIETLMEFDISSMKLKQAVDYLLLHNKQYNSYSQFYLEGEIGWRWLKAAINLYGKRLEKVLKHGIMKSPCHMIVLYSYLIVVGITRIKMEILVKKYKISSGFKQDMLEANAVE